MKYNPHNDWLTKRIAEHEKLAKSFGNGSAYGELLATLKQTEAQHLRVLQERNNVAQEAYERGKREGIAEGRKLERADVVAWLRADPDAAYKPHVAIERGEHVAKGGE